MPARIATLTLCVLHTMWLQFGDGWVQRGDSAEPWPVFETDIQPLLQRNCGKCHSDTVRKGELDLSSFSGIIRGGETGDPLIAESVDESLLWIVVEAGDMPPDDQPQLVDTERELIRRWIESGAKSEASRDATETAITQHDVLPILLLRCTMCHGPRIQNGKLDLRTRASMLQGGTSGSALVPGDPDASLMIQRIESGACPPSELLLKFFVKRPPSAEVEILRKWIAAGAPEFDIKPDVATSNADPLVSDEDRRHWAFQPPVANSEFNSIDDFIGRKLHEQGLSFSPEADRATLIRRAYFDLIGLPPGLEELDRWSGHNGPNWFSEMIDELLASPHYGERWGRYWLDLAGYADSEGGISADPVRQVAWRYRDYVISAFNSDKPYDRFLIEQLAGDELIDHERASEVTQEMVDNLIATGFLRMGIDETGSRTMNFVPERLKVISDAITVVSSGIMGLTMECARCHSHKYDPIPHRDYYRFKAIFQGALDEHDWSSFKTRMIEVATPRHRALVAKRNPPLEAKIARLEGEKKKALKSLQIATLRHHYPDQSELEHEETLVAFKKADNQRTLPQKRLIERLVRAELRPDSEQPEEVLKTRLEIREIDREIDRTRRSMAPPLAIRALWDFGRPSPTYVLRRGEHDRPGKLVGPGVPSVLTDGQTPLHVEPPFPEGTQKTGRRLALAKWLTRRDHPLTSRVMINRIWFHHFGTGLVKDLENFGIKGERPSHPELLDWLAIEFMDRGWSVKEMHRLVMNSQTYRQSSRTTVEHQQLDPQNRLLSRMSLRRLDAEPLRDSLLFVAGKLDDNPGGLPDTVTVDREGLVSVNRSESGGWRRSIYLQFRRTEIPTMMDTFDYPQMGPNCVTRNVSTVSPQSLMLMNNGHIRELAVAFADRVTEVAGQQQEVANDAHVDAVYRLALSRAPSSEELQVGVETLNNLQQLWNGDSERALETYCHAIFNSAAFLFID